MTFLTWLVRNSLTDHVVSQTIFELNKTKKYFYSPYYSLFLDMLQSEWIFYHVSSELLALFTGSMAVILQKIHLCRKQNFSPFRFTMAAMSTRDRVVCALTSNNTTVLKNIEAEMIAKIRGIPTTDFGCMMEKGLLRRNFSAEYYITDEAVRTSTESCFHALRYV